MKTHLSLITLFLVIGLMIGSSPVTLAQEGAAEETKDTFVLDEIVITAKRRETNMQDTPTAVTAVSAEAMDALGIADHDGHEIHEVKYDDSSKTASPAERLATLRTDPTRSLPPLAPLGQPPLRSGPRQAADSGSHKSAFNFYMT